MLSKVASMLFALAGTASIVNAVAVQKRATCAGGQTVANEACCVLFPIMEQIQGEDVMDNQCGDAAHSALRLTFHDGIGISKSTGQGGGADGSIVVFNATELQFHANTGIDDALGAFADAIHDHPEISPGDFIQFANAVGLTNCPGAPRIPFFLGRPQPKAPSPLPNGGVPEPFDGVTNILARMEDAGFSPEEVIALLSSHSVAGADDVDPSIPGTPFDSTHDIFDTQIFVEVQLRGTLFPGNESGEGEVQSAIEGTLRLQSDHDFARDSRTDCIWQSFANNQAKMVSEFQAAMIKLSLLGQDQSSLIDCSDVIPPAKPAVQALAHFPPTLTNRDIEQACATAPFPTLSTLPGPATSIPPIPQNDGDDDSRRRKRNARK